MATDERFERPHDLVFTEQEFTGSEVGLNHLSNGAYVRLRDSGDVEVMATDGLGIIMHAKNRSITIIADSLRFVTGSENGLRWNNIAFNSKANEYHEPTFIDIDAYEEFNPYQGVDQFMYDFDQGDNLPTERPPSDTMVFPSVAVEDPETGHLIDFKQYYEKYGITPRFR